MIYQAYVDDSGDGKKVVVAGAVVGKKEDWEQFARRWTQRLDEDGIEYFKSSHCESLNGQFHKFRELGVEKGKEKAAQLRDDLDEIIKTSRIMSLGVVLSLSFFDTMRADPQQFRAIPTVPYRLAFQQLIAECGKAMKLLGRGNIVKFAHDAGEDFDTLQKMYRGFKTQNRKYQGILWDFVPLDDKLHPAVQAADVAAYVTFKFAQNYLANPNAENLQRLKRNMYKVVNWLDHPHSPIGGFDQETAPAKAVYVI